MRASALPGTVPRKKLDLPFVGSAQENSCEDGRGGREAEAGPQLPLRAGLC